MRASTPGSKAPDEPSQISWGWVELMTVDVSVRPMRENVSCVSMESANDHIPYPWRIKTFG